MTIPRGSMSLSDAQALYNELEARAEKQRASGHAPASQTRVWRRYQIIAAPAMLLAAVAVGAIVLAGQNHPAAQTTVAVGHKPSVPSVLRLAQPSSQGVSVRAVGTDPFAVGGSKVASVAAAESVSGLRIPTPNAALAGPSSLSDVWADTITDESGNPLHQVDVDYVASNIRIIYRPSTQALQSDAAAAFAGEASSNGFPASDVQTVHGVPAFVVAPSNGQNGFVELELDGTDVSVIGYQPISQLIAIASSLK